MASRWRGTSRHGARAVTAFRLAAASIILLGLQVLTSDYALAQAEFRIATEGAYPPFNYVEDGKPAGFEIEIATALCAAMGLPCSFVVQQWDDLYGGLRLKRYDAIMSSMEITPERRTRYVFSRPYYRIPATLIGTKGDDAVRPFQPADLAGRSVGVVRGSEFETYLEALPKPSIIKPYHKLEEAQLDLLTGRLDYVLGDKLELSRFMSSREGEGCCRYVADLPVDRGEGIAVAMRKGDRGLVDMVDAAIAAIVQDGTYDRIRTKYFPFDIK